MRLLSLNRSALYRVVALLPSIFVLTPPAAATLLSWDGNEAVDGNYDGDYDAASNWSPDQIPAAGDMANFNAAANYTVTFGSDEEADELRVVDGEVTFLSDSSTARVFDLVSGSMDANVSGGMLTIGSATNPVVMNVGDIMNIASNAPGLSEVVVSGQLSQLNAGAAIHNIGRNGNNGDLYVTEGAIANYGGTLRVGVDTNSNGRILVSLASTVNTGNLEVASVGAFGVGTLSIADSGSWIHQTVAGATLSVGNATGQLGFININSGGRFTTGTGVSTINAGGTANVGITGDGVFEVGGDIDFVGGSLNVGGDAGDVFDLGSGQTLTASAGATMDFAGGYDIAGTFNIQDATFDVGGEVTISPTGTLMIERGTVNARAGLDASDGTFDFRRGLLSVTGGAFQLPEDVSFHAIDGATAGANPAPILGAGATADLSTQLRIAVENLGSLTVTDGGRLSTLSGGIGYEEGSRGFVGISGTDSLGNPSSWTMTAGIFFVGFEGDAFLTIDGGAQVSSVDAYIGLNASSDGTVTVSGTDDAGNRSTWSNSAALRVVKGRLTVEDGAQVTSLQGIIGSLTSGESTVTVRGTHESGTPSTWVNDDFLAVGGSNTCVLDILDGGKVFNVDGSIGNAADGDAKVTVSGVGSKWTNYGSLSVGGDLIPRGPGSLTITEDGLVQVDGTLTIWGLGRITLDGGTLKVDSTNVVNRGTLNYLSGTIHLTDAGGYTVGANSGPIDQVLGFDHVAIPNGGGLVVDEALSIPVDTSLAAVAGSIAADELTNNGLLYLSNSTLTTAAGTANNADMVLVNTSINGPVDNAEGSTVTVLGTVAFEDRVSGSGDFFGPGTASFNGGMAPGASPAHIVFEGNVALGEQNTLHIELGGAVAGDQFDVLEVAGDVSLAGTLQVALIDDFALSPGDSFVFLDVDGARSGEFNGMPEGGLVGTFGEDLFITYTGGDGNDVTLFTRLLLAADFDKDGDVDGEDFLIWQSNFNTAGPHTSNTGDADGDGDVDGEDFLRWQALFGTSLGGSGASVAVPEPATASVLMIAAANVACLWRNSRKTLV